MSWASWGVLVALLSFLGVLVALLSFLGVLVALLPVLGVCPCVCIYRSDVLIPPAREPNGGAPGISRGPGGRVGGSFHSFLTFPFFFGILVMYFFVSFFVVFCCSFWRCFLWLSVFS